METKLTLVDYQHLFPSQEIATLTLAMTVLCAPTAGFFDYAQNDKEILKRTLI